MPNFTSSPKKMQILDCIKKRRSIRNYTSQEIPETAIKQILEAGMNAPSARNLQPREFALITDKQLLEKLSQIKTHAHMVKESNITIVVWMHNASNFYQQEVGACMQNMMLTATALGIGSCRIGINAEQESQIRSLLNVPRNLHIPCLLALGYPNEEKDSNNNFLKEKIHENWWQTS